MDVTIPHTISMTTVFLMLFAFQVKHFICDYPLQTNYHLQKGKPGWEFFLPLSSHCSVHAVGTWMISVGTLWHTAGPKGFFVPFGLAAFDFVCHFVMDRVKAGPKYLGRFKDLSKSAFWSALGFDQMVHHCTHLAIVWYLAKYGISQ